MSESRTNFGARWGLGLFLIGLGVLFFLGQFFNVWRFLWPFIIIGVGLLFFVGMLAGGKETGGLAIPGSIITMTGLVLLYQNTLNHWASWAYAWSLVGPTAVGIGLYIFGRWSDKPEVRRAGVIVTAIGLIIFLVAGAFFELIFSLTGLVTPGRFVWPLLLILLGVFLLFGRGLRGLGQPPKPRAPTPAPASPSEPTAPETPVAEKEGEK